LLTASCTVSITATLRQAMADSGLTQRELADIAKVPQPSISRFMKGERGLQLSAIELLTDHLGLELTEKPQPKKKRG
jgi:transcriptional regulator with XRE-family HTH domain